ncbi:MAG: TraB/GumN family protein [Deltaproteobacteria bacterium]|jgi:uncharacterized protein YbaP (TraB family)|nr:TraB/GumN family protein [Deltaproteobacteria bacterium]
MIPKKLFFQLAAWALFWLLAFWSAAAWAGNFLWSVDSPEGNRVYLMGSVHLASEDFYPVPEKIQSAFNSSTQLMVEADIMEADSNELKNFFFNEGLLPPDMTLPDLLKSQAPEMLQAYNDCLKTLPGMGAVLNHLKPWLAALTLESTRLLYLGYDPKLGLDLHFIKQAKERGIEILELESMMGQLNIFTHLTEQEGLNLLKVTILEFDPTGNDIKEMMEILKNGDVEGFERLYFKVFNENPELIDVLKVLIIDRNQRMFERIGSFFKSGQTTFVVVGAAHLVGPDGLVEKFKQAGYLVTKH